MRLSELKKKPQQNKNLANHICVKAIAVEEEKAAASSYRENEPWEKPSGHPCPPQDKTHDG
jgi:hypothetical protein